MSDLIEWLRAQLDEDERIAVEAALLADSERWTASARNGWDEIRDARRRRVAEAYNDGRTHIARHDPARVLAEVAAKRQIVDIVDAYEGALTATTVAVVVWSLERAVRLLALPYADQPGYLNEWRP